MSNSIIAIVKCVHARLHLNFGKTAVVKTSYHYVTAYECRRKDATACRE